MPQSFQPAALTERPPWAFVKHSRAGLEALNEEVIGEVVDKHVERRLNRQVSELVRKELRAQAEEQMVLTRPRMEETIQAQPQNQEDIRERNLTLEAEMKELRAKSARETTELDRVRALLQEEKARGEDTRREAVDLKAEVESLREQAQDARTKGLRDESELEQVRSQLCDEQARVEDLERELERVRSELQKKELQLTKEVAARERAAVHPSQSTLCKECDCVRAEEHRDNAPPKDFLQAINEHEGELVCNKRTQRRMLDAKFRADHGVPTTQS